MLCKIKQIQGYEDRVVDYSGITLNDRFFFFHVSKKRSEELEERTGFQAGILRYDVLTDTSEFVAYPSSVYFESYVPGKTSIHMAELQWEQMNATFILYKFDCNTMKSAEIYRLNFTDSIADSSDVSALWRIEINSLSDQYILLGIPDLDPFSDKDNHGFEKYLLLDIVNQVSYPVQESLGERDSILNFARLQRFMYEETDYLVLHTGRMTSFEKEELWVRKGKNMRDSSAYQSKIMLSLEGFIQNVKQRQVLPEGYIIDQCDHSSAYVSITPVHGSCIYIYKKNLINHTSELIKYHISTQSKQVIPFTNTFARIMMREGQLVGVSIDSSQEIEQLHDLAQGTVIFTGSPGQVIKWANKDMIITQSFSIATSLRHLHIYDISTRTLLDEIVETIPNFDYIESRDTLFIFR